MAVTSDELTELTYAVPDPIRFKDRLWPAVRFYRKQREIIYSVLANDETYVTAGNMLGKDYVAGFLCVYLFLTRHPCRIVTTSAKDDHLRVLWGEIMRFVQTCALPLDYRKGGPLIINHQDIRKMVDGERCPISYMTGLVASQDSIAAMQGHHVAHTGDGIPRAFFVSDESSSVANAYYDMADTWAHRKLIFGNPWPCDNFFKRGVKAGDEPSPDPGRMYRKVIRISAEDSPNVRLGLAEQAAGLTPSRKVLIPGVKDWDTYQRNKAQWDEAKQCVALGGNFYEGRELLLFPPEWVRRATLLHAQAPSSRKAKAIGCDPGEGGANSSWTIGDEYGVIRQVNIKTPDTSVIPDTTLALMREYNVPAHKVLFDRGGGGKQAADQLRSKGHTVGTIGFGEAVTLEPKRGLRQLSERKENLEERYAFVNRRAQIYGEASELFDPALGHDYAIPPECDELLRQLQLIPKLYDGEGRLRMLPKNKRDADSKEKTLTDVVGRSPDEADSFVLMVHALLYKTAPQVAGAVNW